MKEIITKDGSITFFNEKYDDVYNSISGAIEEARKKFVDICKVKELSKKRKIIILDVCFGVGYNSLLSLVEGNEKNIEIIGLENDEEVIKQITKMKMEGMREEYELIVEGANACLEKRKSKSNITIILGDARKEIKGIVMGDIVFLDPFSPKKCPELWEEQFIKDISKKMKIGSILATYSCARKVRDNLKNAGLEVHDGPCVGRKAPSTYAVKK